MGGVFSNRDNLIIPDAVFQEYNYTMDAFIDGVPGKSCLLIYPATKIECPNCFLDPNTDRSTNVYKNGGPQSFINFTICPLCGGEGYRTNPNTESIRLRVYYNPKDFLNTGTTITAPDGTIQIIGYMTDYPKVQKSIALSVNSELNGAEIWKYKKQGEAVPWGFNQRYFVQLWSRIK